MQVLLSVDIGALDGGHQCRMSLGPMSHVEFKNADVTLSILGVKGHDIGCFHPRPISKDMISCSEG